MDKKLLEILVCPLCKGQLIYEKQRQELRCVTDHLAFPIRDHIPILIESEARSLTKDSDTQL